MTERLRHTENYQKLLAALQKGESLPWLSGMSTAAAAYLLAHLVEDFREKSFLIVLPTQQESESLSGDIQTYRAQCHGGALSTSQAAEHLLFPARNAGRSRLTALSKNTIAARIHCFQRLLQAQQRSVIVTTSRALQDALPARDIFATAFHVLKQGDEVEPDAVEALLCRGGYQRVALVEVKGEFARRGDILDVYPLTADTPARLEFFGDELDAIRAFDATTQRSTEPLDAAALSPMRELLATEVSLDFWQAQTEELLQTNATPQLVQTVRQMTQRLTASLSDEPASLGDELTAYLPLLCPETANLIDYLPDDLCVVRVEPQWQKREAAQRFEEMQTLYQQTNRIDSSASMPQEVPKQQVSELVLPPDKLFVPFAAVEERLAAYPVLCASVASPRGNLAPEVLQFGMKPLALPRGNYQTVLTHLHNWVREGYDVVMFCESPQQAKRVSEMLAERDIVLKRINVGAISHGFLDASQHLVVISEEELFGSRRHHRPHRPKSVQDGTPILSLMDLKVGDYVVHVSHGIAIYDGIRRLALDGGSQDSTLQQDFLVLKYSSGDILYVPTDQVDMVQKYIGSHEDSRKPRVDKLGGADWHRRKARAKASIEQMADELLKLYAVRQARQGYAFPEEVPWQAEFETLFPYQETEDQIRAIEDVTADMETERPMDRLICGDVGYGKTEVALRAAFKAVMAEKQVAVLVPTTILALQHYDTFEKRFKPFPVQVEILSRFRTPKEIKQVKAGLGDGTVDIVIGTHSLLSKTVAFANLGLLVVDEEHRFGVKHKERIKQLKETVDVLTLTATPIPRTLHMSLVGIRDFSLINTPPANRMPIQTHVMPYTPEVIREAILAELARDGQVFFVHNRVQSIQTVAQTLQQLVPEARVAVAHGQMPERELESVMLEFVRHKHDVLVCTMIIESGLDIPNVNTILIDRADALGLAQLYQLRGRVGRADVQAYGYLFYPQNQVITEGAQKRLRVIEEFTELGSGFKIALRDLEIRGAGTLLGAEQHGHIVTVGYELYCKLLEEAVQKLKGEEVEEQVETRIRLPVEAYLPDDYVPDSRQKVALYKKIAALKSDEALQELRAELMDRYGAIPKPAAMLLAIASLKPLCQRLSITAIVGGPQKGGMSTVKITFDERAPKIDIHRLMAVIQKDPSLRLLPPAHLVVRLRESPGETMLYVLAQKLKMLLPA